MFFLSWMVSGGMVIFEGFLAWLDGLLTKKQSRVRYNWAKGFAKVAVFMEHGGMWGDFFLVSPISSWMWTYYRNQWTGNAVGKSFLIALAIGLGMLVMWVKGSKHLIEPFARFGKVTFNGVVHFLYMVIHLTIIFLFFFHTPKVDPHFVWVAVVGLGIHIAIGLLQPEWNTYRRINPVNLVIVGVAVSLLIGKGWFLTH
jgi:hypothetical protein